MAKKIIRHDDLFEPKITKGLIKELDDLIKKGNETEKELKDILKVLKEIQSIKSAKGLREFTVQTEKLNKAQSQRAKNQQISIEIGKKIEAQGKRLKVANSDRIQQQVQLTRLTKEQNASNKDAEILNNKSAGTLEKLAASSRKLRREREKLNLDTEKGRKRLIEINKQLDKNNKIVLKNSDSLKKQKINVGNYSESIKEAASASGLFGKVLGPLSAIQGTLNALMKKNTLENEANAAATQANAASTKKLSIAQRASAVATGIGTKALKVFKFALASTGIGLLVVALGSLISFFSRSQKGIDFLKIKMASLGAVVDVIIDAFSAFGEAIFDVFSKPKEIIDSLIKFIKRIPKLVLDNLINRFKAFGVILRALINADLKGLADGFLQLSTGVTDFTDKAIGAIEKVKEVSAEAAEATRLLAKEMEEKARIAGILQELTIKLNREELIFTAQQAATANEIAKQTLIFKDKLKADKERLAAVQKTNRLEIKLSERQLELEQAALAASLDSLSENEKSLKLDSERLKFIEDIKSGNIDSAEAVEKAAAFTLSSAEGEEALKDVIEKVNALEAAKLALLQKQSTTAKRTASVTKEIATKNATALTREAAAFRELAKNQDESLDKRIELITKAAELEIESFKVQVDANIKNEKELAAAKIQINAKLIADLKKLREKGTVEENNTTLKKEKELQVDLVNQIEQELLQQDIERLQRRLETEELTKNERTRIINELFDTQRTKAQAQAEFLASLEGKTAEEIELINLKKVKELEDIENARVDAVKEANDDILKNEKDLQSEREKIINSIVSATVKGLDKMNEAENASRDAAIEKQETALSVQEERAKKGLTNTLAFEQEQLDKANLERQRELERQAKQQEVIALVQAYLNQFQELSKTEPDTAAFKAFTNTLLAKSVAKGLTGFIEGTELVERDMNGSKFSSGQDGYIAKFDGKERILNPAQNMALPKGMTNAELVQAAQDYSKGNTWGFMPTFASNADSGATTKAIIESNKQIIRAIQDNAASMSVDSEGLMHLVESRVSRGKKELIHFINKKYKMLPK